MAKLPDYRLKTLVDIRERKKEAAERHLGQCLQNLKKEQDRQKEMELELERMVAKRELKKREYMEKAMQGSMSAQAAINSNQYIERLKELEAAQKAAIEGQKAVVAQREEDVKDARVKLTEATQELKALEKHREKWEEQLKKEAEAKQEEAIDDLNQSIFFGHTHE